MKTQIAPEVRLGPVGEADLGVIWTGREVHPAAFCMRCFEPEASPCFDDQVFLINLLF